MEVLFNYKRTVEDFKQCGGKAGNPYNFPFVSECVGPSDAANGPCKESSAPVPCGDGTCRSDYVACLRALSDAQRRDGLRSSVLWAFQEYTQARTERGWQTLASDTAVLADSDAVDADAAEADSVEKSTDVAAAASMATVKTDDRYMDKMFGPSSDKSRGTARAPDALSPRSTTRRTNGPSRLGASSDIAQWGGTLSYDANGAENEEREERV